MKNVRRFTALIALTLIALAANTATATEGVSPGAVDRMAQVNNACPTFSWGENDGTAVYELVAYVLPEDTSQEAELTADNEVLFARVSGSATSWTPSSEQSFDPGGRYVWFVRSVTEMIDDQIIEAGEWSAGRYFSVPAGPSAEDVARAVEVLKRWEAANGGGEGSSSLAGMRSGGASPTLRRYGSGGAHAGSSHPKSVSTAAAAIRGEHPDISGEVYGVVGTSASADGAGVAAANLDGGPDLVLDGVTHGETDTALSEAGIDRASVNSEVFEVKNSGPGGMRLSVEGEIAATALECPNCVDSLTIADGSIIDNDLADDAVTEEKIEHDAVGTTKLQNSSVTSVKIADGAVGTLDLADGSVAAADLSDDAVTGAKIADGAVGESNLRSNAVTTGKIADGTIVQADLALSSVSKNNIQNDAVVSGKILDGTIGSADLADGAVTGAKIADGTIGSVDLADSAVTGAKIADGTIASADIGSSQVSSTHILNMGVDTADLAPGAVTSSKIEDDAILTADLADGAVTGAKIADGSITAAHIALIGGLYSSKSWLYVGLESEGLAPGGCTFLTAQCDDANDLPLQGLCVAEFGISMEVRHEDAYNWDSTTEPAEYACHICYPEGISIRHATAKLICITVAGS